MGFRRNMTEALELPKEILLHLPLISFIGQEEVTIENYNGDSGIQRGDGAHRHGGRDSAAGGAGA